MHKEEAVKAEIQLRQQPINLPEQNTDFIDTDVKGGRNDLLKSVYERFAQIKTPIGRLTLVGMPGVGKTQLAIEYAHRYKDNYNLVCWIGAENEQTLGVGFSLLAQKLELKIAGLSTDIIVKNVYDRLINISQWLLIFDNALDYETLKLYLPHLSLSSDNNSFKKHILITSVNSSWKLSIDVGVFEPDEAKQYIQNKLQKETAEQALKLAGELGYLPLALTQAVAYIQQASTNIIKYLEVYEKNPLNALDSKLLVEAEAAYQLKLPVYKVLSLFLNKFREQEQRLALKILRLCAYLGSDQIPKYLLTDFLGDDHITNEVVASLKTYSLVTTRDDKTINIHRLVQKAVQIHLQVDAPSSQASPQPKHLIEKYTDILSKNSNVKLNFQQIQWIEETLKIIDKNLEYDLNRVETFEKSKTLFPHVNAILSHAFSLRKDHRFAVIIAQIYLKMGGYYLHQELNLKPAIELFRKAQECVESGETPEIVEIQANIFNNLGLAFAFQGDYEQAINNSQLGLQRYQKISEIAQGFNKVKAQAGQSFALSILGLVSIRQYQFSEANEKFAQARKYLPIEKTPQGSFGGEKDQLIVKDSNVSQEQFSEKFQQKENQPIVPNAYHFWLETGCYLQGCALVCEWEGNSSLAKCYIEAALFLLDQYSHKNQPPTLYTLGKIVCNTGDYSTARKHYKKAFDLVKKMYSPDLYYIHVCTLHILDPFEADLEKLVLSLKCQYKTPQNYIISFVLSHLAEVLCYQGEFIRAQTYYKKALSILEACQSPNLEEIERIQQALQEIEKVVAAKLQIESENSPQKLKLQGENIMSTTAEMVKAMTSSSIAVSPLEEPEVVELLNLCKQPGADISAVVERIKQLQAHKQFNPIIKKTLFTAAAHQQVEIVKGLLETKLILVSERDELGNTLLHIAAENGDEKLFDHCKRFININATNHNKQTPLHVAIEKNQPALLKGLIKLGLNCTARAKFADVNALLSRGVVSMLEISPLHYAVYAGYQEVVDSLLSSGKITAEHLKETVSEKGNLLHLAVAGGHADMVAYLLGHKTFSKEIHKLINLRNEANFSPLGIAVYSGQIDIIQMLVANDLGVLTPKDQTLVPLLHCAVYACNHAALVEVVKYLQNNPEALHKNLVKRYALKQLPELEQFGVAAEDKNIPAEDLAERFSAGLSKLPDKTPTQQKYIAELDAVHGFLASLEPLADNAALNEDEEAVNTLQEFVSGSEKAAFKTRYQNLVLQGGGPKGIAFVGAIKGLEICLGQGLPNIKRIAGTSAGAITALVLALGLTHQEILQELRAKKISDFIENSFDPEKVRLASDKMSVTTIVKAAVDVVHKSFQNYHQSESALKAAFHTLMDTYHIKVGLCEGKDFLNWLESIIQKYTGIQYLTFGELHALVQKSPLEDKENHQKRYYKDLYVVMTQLLPTADIRIINSETSSKDEKDLIISDAIRASMSIPGVFSAHLLHFKHNGKRYPIADNKRYVDGGLLLNYPIQLFDNVQFHPFGLGQRNSASFQLPNRQTLGLSLFTPPDSQTESLQTDVHGLKNLLKSIGAIYTNAEAIYANLQRPIDKSRTVRISNLGVSLFEFDIAPEKQAALIQEGYQSVKAFSPEFKAILELQGTQEKKVHRQETENKEEETSDLRP